MHTSYVATESFSMMQIGSISPTEGRRYRTGRSCRNDPASGTSRSLLLAVFVDFEFAVDRFDTLGTARNLNGFVRFLLTVGRTAQPDDAISIRIDLDMLCAAEVFRSQDYRRPIKNRTITIIRTTPTIPLGP